MSAPRQAHRSASGFLALVASVTACQFTTDQNGRAVVPTFDATTVPARTTLEHVTLEATTVHLEQEGPETPAGGAQFSCASSQTFVIGGTATAHDEPQEVGTFAGRLAISPPGGVDAVPGPLVAELQVVLSDGSWGGFILSDPRAGILSCTITETAMDIRVGGDIGWAFSDPARHISLGGPAYAVASLSIAPDMTLISFALTLDLLATHDPAEIALDPSQATHDVGTSHTVIATVRDFSPDGGLPLLDAPVVWAVQGATVTSGQCLTDPLGQCRITYQGPLLPGTDEITAFVDANGDGQRTGREPEAFATNVWRGTDDEPPVITAPPDVSTFTAPSMCSATLSGEALGTATASDNIAVESITRSPSGNVFPEGSTTVTWTATDNSGNTATATQTVTVSDNELPTIAAPAEVVRVAESGSGTFVPDADLGTATVNDNCPGATASVAGVPAGNLFPINRTTLTWTATDPSGNTASVTQVVFVRYNICTLFDQTRAVRLGSTVPVKVEICTASGANLSAPDVTVHATSLEQVSGTASGSLDDSGEANPDLNFRYVAGSAAYIFNLSTKPLANGTWLLRFTVAGLAASGYTVQVRVN